MRWNPKLITAPYAHVLFYVIAGLLILPQISELVHSASPYNGFDVSDSLVPASRIYHGGPPRDGIPAIDQPDFIAVDDVKFLQGQDRVLGLDLYGAQRAYPVRILDYHEIVNDRIGEISITITWCPLCGSGMAFAADLEKKRLHFGVSGLLYNSDMLLYDRNSHSLWSQLMGQAISGPLKGSRLRMLPLQQTSWADWRRRYPNSQVLSTDTGYYRDYSRSPYPGYSQSETMYFPVDYSSRRYHPKEQVIGLELDGHFKAYPFSELSKHGEELLDEVAGKKLRVIFQSQHGTGKVMMAEGKEIPTVISYWFAWYTFHPDTAVFRARLNSK